MLRLIDQDPSERSILLTGCPGTGKTTVSIWRFIRLRQQQRPAMLFTFQHMLRVALQNLAQSQNVPASDVSTVHKWYSRLTRGGWLSQTNEASLRRSLEERLDSRFRNTELIIDEGQDLENKIHNVLPHFFGRATVGADDAQQVHSRGTTSNRIKANLGQIRGPVLHEHLQYNYRNPYVIYNFARHFVPDNAVANDPLVLERLQTGTQATAEKPTVFTFRTEEERNHRLKTLLLNTAGNIAVLAARIPAVNNLHRLITTDMRISATKYHSDCSPPTSIEKVLVTTYKSAKGMEFDAVILPEIELDTCSLENEWYVACTRAVRNLYIFSRTGINGILKSFPRESYDHVKLHSTASNDIPF